MAMTELLLASNVYLDRDMAAADVVPVPGGTAAVFTARSPEKVTPNEDAAAVLPFEDHSAVLIVADGCGGAAAGEHASRLTIAALQAAVESAAGTDTLLRTAIINGIEQANLDVQSLGFGAATTVAVVEWQDGTIRPYHVGDSMVLVVGGRGKIKLQTVSHSPVGYGVEAGLLDETDAIHHEDRHIISNFLGTPKMHIEIGPPIKLAKRDTVLLASDGLFDNLHLPEIVECIRKGKLPKSTDTLVARARGRMREATPENPSKPDDITTVVFRQS